MPWRSTLGSSQLLAQMAALNSHLPTDTPRFLLQRPPPQALQRLPYRIHSPTPIPGRAHARVDWSRTGRNVSQLWYPYILSPLMSSHTDIPAMFCRFLVAAPTGAAGSWQLVNLVIACPYRYPSPSLQKNLNRLNLGFLLISDEKSSLKLSNIMFGAHAAFLPSIFDLRHWVCGVFLIFQIESDSVSTILLGSV